MITKHWAIEPSFLLKYRQFKKKFVLGGTAIDEYLEKISRLETEELVIADGVAIIDIIGNLSDRSDFYSWLFDRTVLGYRGIIERLNSAEVNPDVKSVMLRVNSPGGRLDGLFDLLYRIKSFSKPIESLVGARADSAAYGIVSQTDKITAATEMSELGSVGVGVSFFVDEEIVDITSTAAPDKWPDVTKAEGVAVVRSELDEIHEKFAGIIAEGRAAATGKSIAIATVNTNFGKGGTMLAESALTADMIDEIIPAPDRVSNPDFFTEASSGKQIKISRKSPSFTKKPEADSVKNSKNLKSKKEKMDLKTLKAENPEVYDAVFAAGVADEQKRAEGLLIAGKSSGKHDYAIECVKDGKSRITDDVVFATFKSGEINKKDVKDRKEDDPGDIVPTDPKDKKDDDEALRKKYLERRKKKNPEAYKEDK